MNGRNDVVSIDHLKPAFYELSPESTQPTLTDSTSQQQTALPTKLTRVTRLGRHVRWPKHLCSIYSLIIRRGSTVVGHVISPPLQRLNLN